MIHPETELVLVDRGGRGVRAIATLPRGTVVWIRDRFDIALTPRQVSDLPVHFRELVNRWGYRDSAGRWIVCADHGRFVNHSCEANLRSLGEDALIAVRDIAAGSELTCDYAECNVALMGCDCGDAGCRGAIAPADLAAHAARWDREIRAALAGADRLPQPLLDYVDNRMRIDAWLSGLVPPPSVVELAINSTG